MLTYHGRPRDADPLRAFPYGYAERLLSGSCVCAQARAIENECFVVIAGSVGNLPRVHNMDIQYAQSGVFTPCDFAFPTDGKRAEATPNTEMILVSDVDLDLLNELHTYGSVRNLRDRRHDLYELRVKKQ